MFCLSCIILRIQRDKEADSIDLDEVDLCYSLRAFKSGSQGLPMWSKGVLDYESGVCCFKVVKTTAKILIVLA